MAFLAWTNLCGGQATLPLVEDAAFRLGDTGEDEAADLVVGVTGAAPFALTSIADGSSQEVIQVGSISTSSWSALIDNFDDNTANDVAMDGAGNHFYACSIDDMGDQDFMLLKYDSTGILQWARFISSGLSGSGAIAEGVATDSTGSAYIAGSFANGALSSFPIEYGIAKYDGSGVFQWSSIGSDNTSVGSESRGNDVAVDSSGNALLIGSTKTSGPIIPFTVGLVVKFDSSGVRQWTRKFQRSAFSVDQFFAGVTDGSGNIYVTGRSNVDLLVLKYNSSGSSQWSKAVPGTGFSAGNAIAVGTDGNIYVGGERDDVAVLLQFLPDGTKGWEMTFPSTGTSVIEGIGVNSFGTIVLLGTYTGTLSLQTTTLAPFDGADEGDCFFIALSPNPAWMPGQLQFAMASASVGEPDGPLNLTVDRVGGSTGAVSARVRTLSGTASGSEGDYSPFSFRSIDFADGETSRMVTVDIGNDHLFEPVEMFSVELFEPSGGVTIGTQDDVTVSITSEDTAYDEWSAGFFSEAELEMPSVSGPGADPDKDGLINAGERGWTMDPTRTDLSRMPEAVPLWIGEDDYLAMKYYRPVDHADFTYDFFFAVSPGAFPAVPSLVVEHSVQDNGDGTETVIVRDNQDKTVTPERFMKTEVRQAGP